jgi:hypothetical protein
MPLTWYDVRAGPPGTGRRVQDHSEGMVFVSQDNDNNSEEEVEPVRSGNVILRTKVQDFQSYLLGRAESSAGVRSTEVTDNQVAKILQAAETGEEQDVWDADEGGLVSAKDFAHTPTNVSPEFVLHGFTIAASSDQYDAPLGVFASLDTTIVSVDPRFSMGETVVINTGAPLILAKARALEARGMLPQRCVIVAIPARKGDVLKLRPAPERAEAGATA